jgi:hypothetical protein
VFLSPIMPHRGPANRVLALIFLILGNFGAAALFTLPSAALDGG